MDKHMKDMTKYIQDSLFELQDAAYKSFHCRLMPTVEADAVIGVRTPELRKLGKRLWQECKQKDEMIPQDIQSFMDKLPHKYYEENNIHAVFIEQIKDYEVCIDALEQFLPYVDNWATCDIMSPKILGRHTDELLDKIKEWICRSETYVVRFGIGCLMRYYLDEKFKPEYLGLVTSVQSDEYYINMMIAWYLATALAKQYPDAVLVLEDRRLAPWIHNKAIQKAVESNRIPEETKTYLRTLKMKQ
ncbi:MAG: DNA alkylation repair protein [Clostridium sp.]|nr:DNA alkylation repair protein [Clostridium sp.]MCM1460467.1 DNA alkylation repair protein [Bacteroides sp.]